MVVLVALEMPLAALIFLFNMGELLIIRTISHFFFYQFLNFF